MDAGTVNKARSKKSIEGWLAKLTTGCGHPGCQTTVSDSVVGLVGMPEFLPCPNVKTHGAHEVDMDEGACQL